MHQKCLELHISRLRTAECPISYGRTLWPWFGLCFLVVDWVGTLAPRALSSWNSRWNFGAFQRAVFPGFACCIFFGKSRMFAPVASWGRLPVRRNCWSLHRHIMSFISFTMKLISYVCGGLIELAWRSSRSSSPMCAPRTMRTANTLG